MKKKIINNPADCVRECAEGFLAAFGDKYEKVPEVQGLKVREPKDKVAFMIGGGSGHEPLFSFFLGENLADVTVAGNIFASPNPNSILKCAQSVERGRGILMVYGNYAGDNLNFDMAADLMEEAGIKSRTVRVWDDIASAPKDRVDDRRGIAGDLFVVKIGGAVTGAGLSLDECYRVTAKARDNLFSVGVALSGGVIPGESKAAFELPEDEMEFGLGVHGEPGIRRVKMMSANEIVDELLALILKDSGITEGDEICTLINGLGSTTLMELHIMNRRLAALLRERRIVVHDMEVNSYITCQEMAGASISLLKLDDEIKKYYDTPCDSPYFKKP
ncbi:MAG: dihydroxyacetone kinase subunit DhaK [Synergistaceae bacterium]|nr:dihydroxyacetone kinase subunit DhaK [Synergistaceae bacterium]